MFEIAAALALFCAIIIGVAKDVHTEGFAGFIAFVIIFAIAFAIIGGIFALIALLAG